MAFLILVAFLLESCSGCMKSLPLKSETKAPSTANDAQGLYALNGTTIFSQANYFVYKSELSILTTDAVSTDQDWEHIEIIGAKPRILLKKSTDNQHFIEILKEHDNYFVRNGGKEFRKGSDNQPMYDALLDDGLNILSFMLGQFSLYSRISPEKTRQGKRIFAIKPGPVSLTAPFVVSLVAKVPDFSSMQSQVRGIIEVDDLTEIPTAGQFEIALVGQKQRGITMKASFTLDMKSSGTPIAMPIIRDDEPMNFPVDITRRFNENLEGKP